MEAGLAKALCDTKRAVMLHGARVVGRALGLPARIRLGIEQQRAHAVAIEEQRKHQPDRPAANNDNGHRVFRLPARRESLRISHPITLHRLPTVAPMLSRPLSL